MLHSNFQTLCSQTWMDAIPFAVLDTKASSIDPASAYPAELNDNWVISSEARIQTSSQNQTSFPCKWYQVSGN